MCLIQGDIWPIQENEIRSKEKKELLFFILFISKNFKEPSRKRQSLFDGKYYSKSILESLLKNYFTRIRKININNEDIDPGMKMILNIYFE